ncbi:hypothetical protein NLJ89_g11748 [Agrocybe chaxingu]|uniref:CxC2-like cysteine cluster KDZ transposase-associated domain-containing protein n=1 Tax=Agrocybe chaxingu TaxID=84603 RepID=A0A9W8JN55_9AGAR|nr:hypothetical protein NLJ89_g11748 [Agrocybe chaxingu]
MPDGKQGKDSQRTKPKKKKARLTYHDTPIPPPEAPHRRHISYSKSTSGDLTTSTSVFKTAARQSTVGETEEEEPGISPREFNNVEETRTTWHVTENDPNDALAGVDKAYLEKVLEEEDEEKIRRIRAKGNQTLLQWIPHCDVFLEELLNHEGRGFWGTEACIVGKHEDLFLHQLRHWNGTYFERMTLTDLGFRKQLGHSSGQRCLNPVRCPDDDFWIVHIRGIQKIGIDFCGCGRNNQNHTIQLLRSRLYPATVTQPKTAATFAVLELYEILSYESKASAFEFYQTLARLTDNTGISPPKDRYMPFLRMTEQWAHLKMLKRAARGHDPAGVHATQEGELAVQCPACPHPGVNMPEGWDKVPDDKRFLHARFIALDANFRLKRKNVSSEEGDPGLSKGWAYCVDQKAYQEHLKKYESETEPVLQYGLSLL